MQWFSTNQFACHPLNRSTSEACRFAVGVWKCALLLLSVCSASSFLFSPPPSFFPCIWMQSTGKERRWNLISRGTIVIPSCRKYPFLYWNWFKEPGCIRRTENFWISSSSCGRASQLDRRGLFERQCRRANTQSGDITGSPADGCHFGTFDRRILFSELRFRTFAGDRILSTINLGIWIEPIRSRQGFFFSLKNVNVTPGTPMFKKFLRQCRHPWKVLRWFNGLMTHLFSIAMRTSRVNTRHLFFKHGNLH